MHGVQYARLMIQKNRHCFYRGKDCIEKYCKDLKELGTEIINFEENEMIPLTNKEIKSYQKQEVCHICKEKFSNYKNKKKVRDHCHYTGKFRGAAHSECNLRYKVPKEIPVVFHNGSTYDYHFIIKKLAEEFEGEFECLGESTEKYITFSVPLKKENDNGKKNHIQISLLITTDLCQLHHQSLLTTYQEFMIKNVKNAWKNKIRLNYEFIRFKNGRLSYKCKNV